MKKLIPLILLLTACSREAGQPDANAAGPAGDNMVAPRAPATPDSAPPTETSPATPPPSDSVPATPDSEKSPEAAARVLERYFAAVANKRFADAYLLWGNDGQATGMTLKQFADSFAKYRVYDGNFGKPGLIEGAAGSAYIEFPVKVTGVLEKGGGFVLEGPMTLRRVNDVDGSTAEQRHWHIASSGLKPHPQQVSYRFIGRWSPDAAKCTAPWRFTATSLKTPAGAVCSFVKVTEVPGGYDIAASCASGGQPRDDRLRLRFAQSARALLVESQVVGDSGLVACR